MPFETCRALTYLILSSSLYLFAHASNSEPLEFNVLGGYEIHMIKEISLNRLKNPN